MGDHRPGDGSRGSRRRQSRRQHPDRHHRRAVLRPRRTRDPQTLALFGHAEPRDFVDVYVLHQRFEREETLRKAAEADPGFDLAMFAATLRTHGRIQDQDFPDIGVPITDIRIYFDTWADEVDPR